MSPPCPSSDSVSLRQLAAIRKIVADETWLEGERRGCRVSEHDPVVVENVCRIVLRIGAELRAAAIAAEGASVIDGGCFASRATEAERDRAA